MSIVAIGLNHRTAPLDLLERMTVSAGAVPKALHDLLSREHVSEAVVLSTCNRSEVYAVAERFHGAYHDIREWFAEVGFLPPEEFVDHLYIHYDTEAAAHLFRVTSGLDSAVVGENEILGQVRRAWEQAQREQATGPSLNLLFRHAIEAGKRARTETRISRNVSSVSEAAVAMASSHLGGLRGRRALLLGAGEMGAGMVQPLLREGIAELLVANRTWERSVELAREHGGVPVRLTDLPDALARAEVLLTSTGASTLMLCHGDLAPVMAGRDDPLLIVDIAVPRDVDPRAGEIEGVTLLDMDDLRRFASSLMESHREQVVSVQRLLDEELDRFIEVSTAREVAPLIAALRTRAEELRQAELERFGARLRDITPEQRDAVEALTRGLVAKLLHDPSVELKGSAGSPRGERLAEALRDLFNL